ncbi:MAG: hypothetical protein NTZ52_00240 [Chlamydiae bacterium]|nr:hypothetical protein [Chlamydiota bacterium]
MSISGGCQGLIQGVITTGQRSLPQAHIFILRDLSMIDFLRWFAMERLSMISSYHVKARQRNCLPKKLQKLDLRQLRMGLESVMVRIRETEGALSVA